jgi:hypothetical protein
VQHDIPGLSCIRDLPPKVSTGQDDHRAHVLLMRRSSEREIVPEFRDRRRHAIQNKKVVMSIVSASKNDKTVT